MADHPLPPGFTYIGMAIDYIQQEIKRHEEVVSMTALGRVLTHVPFCMLYGPVPWLLGPAAVLVDVLHSGGTVIHHVVAVPFFFLLPDSLHLVGLCLLGGGLLGGCGFCFRSSWQHLLKYGAPPSNQHGYLYARYELKALRPLLADLEQLATWNPDAEIRLAVRGDGAFDRAGVKARIRQLNREKRRATR